jgi:Asp-tRNA(Asn)/Glu-tRNA(Gln) amidotransferase B subunit
MIGGLFVDLTIKCDYAKISVNLMRSLQKIETKNIDNIDDIAAAIANECDPAYLVTSNNTDGILDCIGKDYIKEYLGRVKTDD